MKIIPLSQGYFAFVDDDWIDEGYNWCYANGYAVRNVVIEGKRRLVFLHREIMNPPDDMEVDHRSNYTLDDRKENLRVCTRSENLMNQVVRTLRKGKPKSSKYKGVVWHKKAKKWMAGIRIYGERIHLGLFGIDTDAALAYNEAAELYFGEFASLNVIDKEKS